ncbi:TPM domain-containing protein [Chitinophaga sedimenti]|uniref:TPM domain-containing protein n=1 Tax=Chitinophaga sedimenti TaxID=2033606 RepID=UPI002002D2DC|nr:TPM domain-containing protein [Chitinophaga sedimenti]MCK7559527.1 TPM domain-containing protein [Chitinophaga sedimenti]
MRLFPKKELFTEQEKAKVVAAVRQAERLTSGEVRIFVESRCSYVDAFDRAKEVFAGLGMEKTKHRNGVLLYFALLDHQFAILGDQGIHEKVGGDFWHKEALLLRDYFSRNLIVEGIEQCVKEVGESLRHYFPYEADDKNELPDDIVFGR